MRYWLLFWTFAALTAGLSFALISIVVTIRGGRDLREMFRGLLEQRKRHGGDDSAGNWAGCECRGQPAESLRPGPP